MRLPGVIRTRRVPRLGREPVRTPLRVGEAWANAAEAGSDSLSAIALDRYKKTAATEFDQAMSEYVVELERLKQDWANHPGWNVAAGEDLPEGLEPPGDFDAKERPYVAAWEVADQGFQQQADALRERLSSGMRTRIAREQFDSRSIQAQARAQAGVMAAQNGRRMEWHEYQTRQAAERYMSVGDSEAAEHAINRAVMMGSMSGSEGMALVEKLRTQGLYDQGLKLLKAAEIAGDVPGLDAVEKGIMFDPAFDDLPPELKYRISEAAENAREDIEAEAEKGKGDWQAANYIMFHRQIQEGRFDLGAANSAAANGHIKISHFNNLYSLYEAQRGEGVPVDQTELSRDLVAIDRLAYETDPEIRRQMERSLRNKFQRGASGLDPRTGELAEQIYDPTAYRMLSDRLAEAASVETPPGLATAVQSLIWKIAGVGDETEIKDANVAAMVANAKTDMIRAHRADPTIDLNEWGNANAHLYTPEQYITKKIKSSKLYKSFGSYVRHDDAGNFDVNETVDALSQAVFDDRLESWQRREAVNIILEQLDETPLPEVAPIIPTPAPENEPPPVPGETDAAPETGWVSPRSQRQPQGSFGVRG